MQDFICETRSVKKKNKNKEKTIELIFLSITDVATVNK